MDKKYKKIWDLALPYLMKGKRKDFVAHTKSVVGAMEMILRREKGDRDILIAAAILHDVGWAKVPVKMQKSWMKKELKVRGEELHLEFASPIVESILRKVGYTGNDIKKVIEIILAHKFSSPKRQDKRLLIDADNLADCFKEQFYSDAKVYKVMPEVHYYWRKNNNIFYTKTVRDIFDRELEKRRREIFKSKTGLKKETEQGIKKAVLDNIGDGGRGDWDIPHTLCTVKWMKKLIEENGGEERVLVPAMYFHDSCYPTQKAGYSFEESQKMKKMHAKRGADFAREVIGRIRGFSQEEITEIYRLVKNHDIHNNISDHNRQLVFEADGLAQLDWQDCPPNFDRENCLRWIQKYFEVERPMELWKTELGRKTIQALKKKTIEYWKDKK
jgi:HD superfamily phosphodiesterase